MAKVDDVPAEHSRAHLPHTQIHKETQPHKQFIFMHLDLNVYLLRNQLFVNGFAQPQHGLKASDITTTTKKKQTNLINLMCRFL